jgi:hypothetical protein
MIRSTLAVVAVLALTTVARGLADGGGAAPVGPTAVVLPASDPMAAEMQAALERSQRDYGALYRRLATARGEAEAFVVQDEMRQQRVALQVELLRIQSAYAHRAGRERLAAQFERAIAELVAPEGARRAPPRANGEM